MTYLFLLFILKFSIYFFFFFFFNDTATTEIYTLSLHDALPIGPIGERLQGPRRFEILEIADHDFARLSGQNASLPRVQRGIETTQLLGNRARCLVAELM